MYCDLIIRMNPPDEIYDLQLSKQSTPYSRW